MSSYTIQVGQIIIITSNKVVLQFPGLKEIRGGYMLAVNQEYVDQHTTMGQTPLSAGDEVALIPPISGGQDV